MPTIPPPASALGATIITTKRKIVADEFFNGLFETALEPDEIITKVSFPIPKKAAYQKFRNPASRFALVGVFVAKRPSEVRVAVTGRRRLRRVPGDRVRGGAQEAVLAEVARGDVDPRRRARERHPRQRRISRPSGRRPREARGRRRAGVRRDFPSPTSGRAGWGPMRKRRVIPGRASARTRNPGGLQKTRGAAWIPGSPLRGAPE